MSKSLYVGNLSFQTTADDLREAFERYGNVTRAQVVSDRETGRSRGFGFVEMANDAEAQKAVEALNGSPFQGRPLTVNEARPREDRGGGGPANGNGNGHANCHSNGNGHGEISAALLARAGVMLKDGGPNTARSEQFADFQSDAPACDNCGSITVRAGNCYLCHNCGNSMGCS